MLCEVCDRFTLAVVELCFNLMNQYRPSPAVFNNSPGVPLPLFECRDFSHQYDNMEPRQLVSSLLTKVA